MFNIQLLSAAAFRQVTGMEPPPSPITAEDYFDAGLPFFSLPNEEPSGVSGMFSDIKSVNQLDQVNGVAGLERELAFPTVELNNDGTVPPFRSVQEMVPSVSGLRIAQF